MNQHTVDNINLVAHFLAHAPAQPPNEQPHTVYILAGHAVLYTMTTLYDHLDGLTTPATLVLSGGIGHSTSYLYDAIEQDPRFARTAQSHSIRELGLPEARVLELVLVNCWPKLAERARQGDFSILVDDKSTNCGQNMLFSKRLIDAQRVDRVIIVQDPTMSIRTLAGLEKYYAEDETRSPTLMTWPTFVPRVELGRGEGAKGERVQWACLRGEKDAALWSYQRFFDLLLGEIPRLRDGPGGYGPLGQGFINHVDIPDEVETAYKELTEMLSGSR